MDESYGTDVDDEYVDDHDYDDADDDTDDDNDHKKDSYIYIYIYTAAGAAPTKTRRHQEVIEVKIYPKLVSGQHVGTRPSRGCS